MCLILDLGWPGLKHFYFHDSPYNNGRMYLLEQVYFLYHDRRWNEEPVVTSQNRAGIRIAAPAEELRNMDGLLGGSGGSIVVH